MTGVGEKLLPLSPPKMPSVLVNPGVPVATKDVFEALGLRHGDLLIGATDVVIETPSWPEGGSIDEWIAALTDGTNDLEAPAIRIEPLIGEVLSALSGAAGVRLARMSGSGGTCFAIFSDAVEAQNAARKIQREHPEWWVHAGTLS
jgi:4-diphosphocytidyl-2-C-methyl-D-erythritol kinase